MPIIPTRQAATQKELIAHGIGTAHGNENLKNVFLP